MISKITKEEYNDIVINRLLLKANKNGDCLEIKKRKKDRYSETFYFYSPLKRKYILSHRLIAYLSKDKHLQNFDLKSSFLICHTCDNKQCINPKHLFIGTYQDNTNDMINKKRHRYGEKSYLSKLTEKMVIDIIAKYKKGTGTCTLAKEYCVDRTTIQYLLKGKTWSYLKKGLILKKCGGDMKSKRRN